MLGALVVSGLPYRPLRRRRVLASQGFGPPPSRRRPLQDERTTVVLEAPGRVGATLNELATAEPPAGVAVVRELTRLGEDVWRGTLAAAAVEFATCELRGEVVLVVEGASAPDAADDGGHAAVRAALGDDPDAGPRQVADRVATALGVPRRRLTRPRFCKLRDR